MLSTNNLKYLSEKQEQLDKYIIENKNFKELEVFDKKIVALYVEVCEFINEERSFKFWSNKKASERNVLLEEYIDGIHFLISLGNNIKFDYESYKFEDDNCEITQNYLNCLSAIAIFEKTRDSKSFTNLANSFFSIASTLSFGEEEIIDAYNIKNKTNFERQDNNY
ncbi:dUTP diphosphatase [Spiroplasma chinense]|uniref:dUTP diphosphatase n=1 Tax=Spiroplasma chinense TaxID=216932 RepID=A0A5B9Y4N5_9MOLU|nr:dUTP diphosphatase [Spiroplasma chinense]QEH62128.1 dUTP diphosphatase [Spiroplasma chinense]